jgi:enoyl-CoA hydratase/carnithine racemase
MSILLRRDEPGIAWLTINRPEARNALSMTLMAELQAALLAIGEDHQIHIAIIEAAGPAFCAGHDLRELRQFADTSAVFEQCSRLMQTIVQMPKPVIACVQGIATAAGCQLVATCDLAVAADTARFATPGVNIGLFCSTPMVALTRAVGRKAAMEMLLTGELVDAMRAREIGLVNQVVPAANLRIATRILARTIAEKSPATVAIGKRAFYRQAEMGLADAYEFTSDVMTRNMATADAIEGIDAFLAKRKPVWSGA